MKSMLEVQHGNILVALMPLKHILNNKKGRLIVLRLGV